MKKTFSDRYPIALSVCLIDMSIIGMAALIAHFIRFDQFSMSRDYWEITIFVVLTASITSIFSGLYDSWRARKKRYLFMTMVVSWSIPFVILLAIFVFAKISEDYSRVWLALYPVIAVLLGFSFRLITYFFIAARRADSKNLKSIFIVGNKEQYIAIKNYFNEKRTYGYHVTEFADYREDSDVSKLVSSDVFISGTTSDEVWICLPLENASIVRKLMYEMRHCTADIRFVPDVDDLQLLNHKINQVGEFVTWDLSFSPMDSSSGFLKRIEDVVLGGAISLLILPVCLIIAILIKCESAGPVLFKQYRDGVRGRKIKVYKFRSMHVHTEAEGRVSQATKSDPRITKVGAFLRRSSLDELPQFFNVLQGRMSVVGPRPHAVAHNEYYKDLVESYMWRHKVKPGITGWAQVNGYRGETDTLDKMEGRVKCDLWYIGNWSLWLDIKIIFMTVFKGFFDKNAY